ncbi:hypothetical protein C7B62_25045 [Pleurocapsa sp. CCALA 161]|uniref:Na-translocating system protein MpsC family protein n=1 Tax=Pleurocapsa sp. CCALA 161 TaxID=2107688 RepID=UPI000D0619B8|nr:Na-translocating system protein MpsC family protein [Pleurocapsa sp. CCALA 161]PSB05518.1 hypothetical protein C7B62_25045 [Pleurocapsa sp. CCALA 161]
MTNNVPSRGEMERNLSQSIQAFYRDRLSCRVGKISCHIFGNQVAIIVENSVTSLERVLNNSEDQNFVRDLRNRIDCIVKSELITKIKQIIGVEVIDLTIDTTLEHNFTGVLVLLNEMPQTRKTKRN